MAVPNSAPLIATPRRRVERSVCRFRGAWPLLVAILFCALPTSAGRAQSDTTRVDLALVLAVDISHSVDWWEYRMQREGLAYAIRQPEVLNAIRSGPHGRIAVTVVQWSGSTSQAIAIPWTVLSRAEDTQRLSMQVSRMLRIYGGLATHIGEMIHFGTRLLAETPFESSRKVIDISGDGHDNITKQPGFRRDEAVAAGITVNGLAIENEEKDLRSYYRTFVIGGPGAFVFPVARYEDFGTAMKKKLIREISVNLFSRRTTVDGSTG
jgi:hypothetical protein